MRLAGYKEGLEKNGLSFKEGLIFEANYNYKEGFELAQRVINSGATAAFVAEDELAAGLLNGLFEAGKKVPEDFEIITSNDSPITSYTRPNLSSISQPVYDLGAVSMRMLTKIMNKEELEEKEILLNHGLITRGTTR
ncbi:Catabolite control protein A [Streptococcus pasteurianus]|nr:Catabolite control protein A [Streptococcus pasteurianus]